MKVLMCNNCRADSRFQPLSSLPNPDGTGLMWLCSTCLKTQEAIEQLPDKYRVLAEHPKTRGNGGGIPGDMF